MRKTIEFLAVVAIVWCLFGVAILLFQGSGTVGSKPSISAPQDVLEVSVKDKEDVLLEDVTAEDSEDGNLNASVFVESISPFDEEQCRTVTYAVFDSDDNLSQTTRRIKYKDYEAPKIILKKSLTFAYSNSNVELFDYVGANSVVDGDISSAVTILTEEDYFTGNSSHITIQVTDSSGITSKLRLKVDFLDYEPVIDIQLTNYLIYVKKGTKIDPKEYIDTVIERQIEDPSLINSIEIQDNYNAKQPGVYEFIYRIERSNGDSGLTKLVVVVEE